jgi:hypothetical protein
MARIPRTSANAIDRLARGAHAFHRFAHHPLCDEYAGEVVRLGRRARICRGCALAALGAATGLAIGIVIPMPIGVSAIVVASGSVLAAKPLRPAGKFASRFLPAARAGAAIASGFLAAIFAVALLSSPSPATAGADPTGPRARRALSAWVPLLPGLRGDRAPGARVRALRRTAIRLREPRAAGNPPQVAAGAGIVHDPSWSCSGHPPPRCARRGRPQSRPRAATLERFQIWFELLKKGRGSVDDRPEKEVRDPRRARAAWSAIPRTRASSPRDARLPRLVRGTASARPAGPGRGALAEARQQPRRLRSRTDPEFQRWLTRGVLS